MGNTKTISNCASANCCGGGGCIDWCDISGCGVCKDIPTEVDITLSGFGNEGELWNSANPSSVAIHGYPDIEFSGCAKCKNCGDGNGTYTLIERPDLLDCKLQSRIYDCECSSPACPEWRFGFEHDNLCGGEWGKHYWNKNVMFYVYENPDGIIQCSKLDDSGNESVCSPNLRYPCGGGILTKMTLKLGCVTVALQDYPWGQGQVHKVGHRWSLEIEGVADDYQYCEWTHYQLDSPGVGDDLWHCPDPWFSSIACGRWTGVGPSWREAGQQEIAGLAGPVTPAAMNQYGEITAIATKFQNGPDRIPCSESSQMQSSKEFNWGLPSTYRRGYQSFYYGNPPCDFSEVKIDSLETTSSTPRTGCDGDHHSCVCDSECECSDDWGNVYNNDCCDCDPDC